MDDLAGKIMEIMNNPENMEKIQSLSGLFSNNKPNEEKPKKEDENFSSENLDISPDMMQTIMKLVPLISSMNKEDNSTRLLAALRPLLGEVRQKRLDESIKIMQMFKVLPLLKNQGIL